MNNTKICKNRIVTVYTAAAVLLAVTVLSALLLGSAKLSVMQVLNALAGNETAEISVIVRNIRLPRVSAAVIAGVGLSVSGLLLQAVTGNDLASPNIIGINSGAGFAVILILSLFPHMTGALPIGAFCGAFAAAMLIVYTASAMGVSKSTVILAGVALTTILNAAISFISFADTDTMVLYSHFSVGGLDGITFDKLALPAVMVFSAVAVAIVLAGRISLLCLGDSLAASLGVKVKLLRTVCLICASLCAASVVSFAGLLGFVGLVVPHTAKVFCGENIKSGIILSALFGAALVTAADMAGRVILAPTEIPVGIVMAFIGAPFFVYLLLRRNRRD